MKYNPRFLQIFAGWLVSNVEVILIMCTPLLAPLPSMFAAMRALERGGWQHATLIGAIIEAMGLAAGAFMGMVESHNHRHPDNQIDKRWGRWLFAFYFIVIEALILSSDPNVVSALLPGLTLVGSVIVGFRNLMRRADEKRAIDESKQDAITEIGRAHDAAEFALSLEIKRREAEQRLELQRAEAEQRLEIDRQKAEVKLSTKLSTVNRQPVNSVDNQPSATPVDTPVDDGDMVDKLIKVYTDNPKTSLRKAGKLVGMSHAGVDKTLNKLAAAGRIHRNGSVEVL